MKREGRQRGSVRTYCTPQNSKNIKPSQQLINTPTAGIFNRVSSKPTNHSKFTGKCHRPQCSDCRLHPAWRSKDKTKGAQKVRSSERALDHGGSMAWQVGDAKYQINKLRFEGYSASRILDELTSHGYHDHWNDDNDVYDENYDDADVAKDLVNGTNQMVSVGAGDEEGDHELDNTGFFDVANVWEPIHEIEGWSLVGEV